MKALNAEKDEGNCPARVRGRKPSCAEQMEKSERSGIR